MAARSLLAVSFFALLAFWKRVKSDNPRRDVILAGIFLAMMLAPCLFAVLSESSDPEELG